jgi:hypothetical protein
MDQGTAGDAVEGFGGSRGATDLITQATAALFDATAVSVHFHTTLS